MLILFFVGIVVRSFFMEVLHLLQAKLPKVVLKSVLSNLENGPGSRTWLLLLKKMCMENIGFGMDWPTGRQ